MGYVCERVDAQYILRRSCLLRKTLGPLALPHPPSGSFLRFRKPSPSPSPAAPCPGDQAAGGATPDGSTEGAGGGAWVPEFVGDVCLAEEPLALRVKYQIYGVALSGTGALAALLAFLLF